MRARRMAAALLLTTVGLALAGCGADDASAADPGAEPVTIKVEFKDGTVTPNGETVEVATGQEVTLEVSADEAGEIHVHSSPEQELAYDAGDSTHTITIDTPGTVDVESHDLDQVIVQLRVS